MSGKCKFGKVLTSRKPETKIYYSQNLKNILNKVKLFNLYKLSSLIILLLIFQEIVFCQNISENRLIEILNETKNIRTLKTKNVYALTTKITSNYESDIDKVAAIACWIILRIRYDDLGYNKGKNVIINVEKILKRRETLCSGYSILFKEMCNSIGIKAELVPGYTRPHDFFPGDTLYRAEHMWSIVQIDNQWKLLDLTWASSIGIQKLQLLRRIMYQLFNIPYELKYKYIRTTDLKWIFREPTKMIQTHFPLDHNVQLLNNIISIDTFCMGESRINSQILNDSIVELQNASIIHYSIISPESKFNYLAKVCTQNNVNNNRDKGYYKYCLILDMVKNSYKRVEKQHLMDSITYKKLIDLKDKACYYLDKSIVDNSKEYSIYSKRNDLWREYINNENRTLKNKSKEIKTRYYNQLKQAKKIRDKHKNISNFINTKEKLINIKSIQTESRPKKNTIEYNKISNELLSHLQITTQKNQSLYFKLDSLFNINSINTQMRMINNELQSYDILKNNNSDLKRRFIFGLSRPLYYKILTPNKHWYANNLKIVDSLNHNLSDSLLNEQSERLELINKNILELYSNFKAEQKLLISLKRNSYSDNNEDSLYFENVTKFKNSLYSYKEKNKRYLIPFREYENIYKKNIAEIKKSYYLLAKDDLSEKKRHRNYSVYRKTKMNVENKRAHSLMTECKNLKRIVKVID